jgi:hypothetical protein
VSAGAAASRFFYDDSLMVSLPEITARQPVAVAYNTGISALDVDFNRVEVDWQLKPDGRFSFRALCIADGMILPADWITFAPASPEVWADTPSSMPAIPPSTAGNTRGRSPITARHSCP